MYPARSSLLRVEKGLQVSEDLSLHSLPNIWIRPLTDPAVLFCKLHRTIFEYWHESRGDAVLPGVEAMDPLSMPRSVMPHLTIIGPLPDGGTYKVRLVGTKLVNTVGFDHTGIVMHPDDGFQAQLSRFKWMEENRQPYFSVAPLTFSHRTYKTYNAVALPFADPEGKVVRIVVVFDFTPYDKIAAHLEPFLGRD